MAGIGLPTVPHQWSERRSGFRPRLPLIPGTFLDRTLTPPITVTSGLGEAVVVDFMLMRSRERPK